MYYLQNRFPHCFLCVLLAVSLCLFISCDNSPKIDLQAQISAILFEKDTDALKNFSPNGLELAKNLQPELSYYIALQYLEMEEPEKAKVFLEYGKDKAQMLVSQLCIEQLLPLQSPGERLSTVRQYYKANQTQIKAKLLLAQELYNQGKYAEVLAAAGLPDLKEYSVPPGAAEGDYPQKKLRIKEQVEIENSLSRLRILALIKLKKAPAFDYLKSWFLYWDTSSFHSEFLTDWLSFSEEEKRSVFRDHESEKEIFPKIMNMRVSVFSAAYVQALPFAKDIPVESITESSQIFSDYGKACLYGGQNTAEAVEIYKSLAEHDLGAKNNFLAAFYLARFYEKQGNLNLALASYEEAMKHAPEKDNYDNALWYYLKTAEKVSLSALINALSHYMPAWNDASYFSDLLFEVSEKLLTARKWNDFVRLYVLILPYADSDVIAKYSYITGRLLSENLAVNPFPEYDKKEAAKICFRHAYEDVHSEIYYRVLAAEELDIKIESVTDEVFKKSLNSDFVPNTEIEDLLLGYAKYGYPEKVFPLFKKEYRSVSLPVVMELCKNVSRNGDKDSSLYSESLKIISWAVRNPEIPLTKEVLELLYPVYFSDEIKKAAGRFDVNDYILFALVRTESFFNKDVVSKAGAVGLAQLMSATAEDVAGRLKVKEYDLCDAETNVQFGAYYLHNLMSRLNDSTLLALLAYNGGPARVRSWIRSSGHLPIDLFLETVPFAETRGYGKSVLAAACLYGYLYYDKNIHQIVSEVMSY